MTCFSSRGKTRCPTLPCEYVWPPVSSGVLYQKQKARGERKPQSTNLFIETNSEQKGKYLVSSAANTEWFWDSPQLKSGGKQPALCLQTEWCTPWGHCRRPYITGTRTYTRLPAHTCTHTQRETITFLCFYECFINHMNGSQRYTL